MSADATRLERALFAARLHHRTGTILSHEAQADIAAELLETRLEADVLASDNQRLRELVAMAERRGTGWRRCPWCDRPDGQFHVDGCLAFNAVGEVR